MTTKQDLRGATYTSAVQADHGCVNGRSDGRRWIATGAVMTGGSRVLKGHDGAATGHVVPGATFIGDDRLTMATPLLPTSVPTGTSTSGPPV